MEYERHIDLCFEYLEPSISKQQLSEPFVSESLKFIRSFSKFGAATMEILELDESPEEKIERLKKHNRNLWR